MLGWEQWRQWALWALGAAVGVWLVWRVLAAAGAWAVRRARLVSLVDQMPGPAALPLLGNALDFNVNHDEIFARLTCGATLFSPELGVVRGWNGLAPWVVIYKAAAAEAILGSSKHLTKSKQYRFIEPWLGTGLLTSSGHKWRARRKLLTPAFHFRVLEDFVAVFHEQSERMARLLQAHADDGQPFNIIPYVTRCALDIICETAMGLQIDAQGNGEAEYVKAIYEIGTVIQGRQAKFWLYPNWIFRLTSAYKRQEQCIKILHDFSNKVIRERKKYLKKQAHLQGDGEENTTSPGVNEDPKVTSRKKRHAFLDLLIHYSEDGEVLSNEDIREEVDTFMFEEKAAAEVQQVLSAREGQGALTAQDLAAMRYLDRCVREALRLYPSVPLIARHLTEDVVIGEYTIPAGTTAVVVTYMLHRDPLMFARPDHFEPDRFLQDGTAGRHPFAYIPFSAGPRNCIGQKFAMLEEKAVIATFLRNFRIEAVDRREDLKLLGELILRPKHGLKVKIYPREP